LKKNNKKFTIYHLPFTIKSGFTVIELIVTTGIIVVILGVVFTGYPQFKARSALSALARSVGLLVREAQVYGLAVKEFPVQADKFPPYGVHVSIDNLREIILFGDLETGERNGIYDVGEGCGTVGTECMRRFTLAGPEYIDKICVNPGGGTGGDTTLTEVCDINELNITFRRPDPEAVIIVDDPSRTYNGATIYLRSKSNAKEHRVVRVWITGQISVQ